MVLVFLYDQSSTCTGSFVPLLFLDNVFTAFDDRLRFHNGVLSLGSSVIPLNGSCTSGTAPFTNIGIRAERIDVSEPLQYSHFVERDNTTCDSSTNVHFAGLGVCHPSGSACFSGNSLSIKALCSGSEWELRVRSACALCADAPQELDGRAPLS